MLRIAICDDEPAQRALLEAYVGEWGMLRQQEVDMALVGSAEQFLFHWEERRRDILLLDIDMPGGMARGRVRDICYLESDAHDTWVHCAGEKEPVRCRAGIRQVEERLEQQGESFFELHFFKLHRSYLVNLAYVNRIERKEAVMDSGEALPVARNRWEALNRAYLDYYRGRWED